MSPPKNLSGGFSVSVCKGLGCGRGAAAESLPRTWPPAQLDPPIPRGYRVGPRRPPKREGQPPPLPQQLPRHDCHSTSATSCRATIASSTSSSSTSSSTTISGPPPLPLPVFRSAWLPVRPSSPSTILQESCKPRPLKRWKTSQKSCSAKSSEYGNQAITRFFSLQQNASQLCTAGGRLCSHYAQQKCRIRRCRPACRCPAYPRS